MENFVPQHLAIVLVQLTNVLELGRVLCNKSTLPQKWFDVLQPVVVGVVGHVRKELFSRNASNLTTVRQYGDMRFRASHLRGLRILSTFASAAVQVLRLADSLSARIGSELSYTSFTLTVLGEHNGAATSLVNFFLQPCGRGLCRWCCIFTIHDS